MIGGKYHIYEKKQTQKTRHLVVLRVSVYLRVSDFEILESSVGGASFFQNEHYTAVLRSVLLYVRNTTAKKRAHFKF